VICYTPIDKRHRFTGACEQIVEGKLYGPMDGLAICYQEAENAYYLFGCDAEWECVTDTWHESLADAKLQAEFEYEGISKTWIDAA
jgi:hypothetical protein